ncbi:MAG: polyketide synthase dehydratase domain-containing protein [Methylocystis sp.]|uniref:polyketide synthase dehydratase domain-containing protein n=1 Tax=Methylocystis sp. TaxID=1911079 RepID=UPI003DA5C170
MIASAVTEAGQGRADDANAAGSMPFIGQAIEIGPDSLVVERVLDLVEDRHLADHAFVQAAGVKPLSACLPVLPMTMSLEAMAEAAACLAPGMGLIRLEDVMASRWIELADVDHLALRIRARRVSRDPASGAQRIHAAIHPHGQDKAAISAAFCFAQRYQASVDLSFKALVNPYRLALSGEDIYLRRHLFHGPSYQCLSGDIVLGDSSAYCEMIVPSPAALFRSNCAPQLLLDPQLLDAVGQLVGVWAMERERYVFPIGLEKLEIYRPSPPPGSRFAVRAEITADSGKTLEADIEIRDGGGVWMRVKAWRMWKFRWDRRLVHFRRAPSRQALSKPYATGAPLACRVINATDFARPDLEIIARFYLHMDEMEAFRAKAKVPRRQREWLMGRIAAKDAIRALLAASSEGPREIHPASLAILYDENRRPLVDPRSLQRVTFPAPSISVTHCRDRAIAVAHRAPVGVDLEHIIPRDAAFREAAFTPAECALLEQITQGSAAALEEWMTRLWCAKEATRKLLGGKLDGGPRKFVAVALFPDGTVKVQAPGEDQLRSVRTQRDGDDIFASCA